MIWYSCIYNGTQNKKSEEDYKYGFIDHVDKFLKKHEWSSKDVLYVIDPNGKYIILNKKFEIQSKDGLAIINALSDDEDSSEESQSDDIIENEETFSICGSQSEEEDEYQENSQSEEEESQSEDQEDEEEDSQSEDQEEDSQSEE
jgi:hypothetical protein